MINPDTNWGSSAYITKYVHTGEIVISSGNDKLISTPLGSCVAVLAYDHSNKISGMAHIMLPGKAPANSDNPDKYAENAIENLIKKLIVFGCSKDSIVFCLAGGGNVLNKETDSISKYVIDSVLENLKRRKLKVVATHLGGFERRSLIFCNSLKTVFYRVGNEKEIVLCDFRKQHTEIQGR